MRTARSLVVLMILSAMFSVAPLSSASDWQMPLHDSRNTGYTNETVPDELGLLWSCSIQGWWDLNRLLAVVIPEVKMTSADLQIRVAEGKVVVIPFAGKIHTLNADTGKIIWSHPFGGLSPPVAIADGKVFVSFDKIYAFDADTGKTIWSYEITGGITVVDGKIFVSSWPRNIYVLDEDTGNLIRIYEIAGPRSIAIAEGKIFVKSETSVQSYLFSMQGGIIEELEEELNKSDIPEVPEDLKMEFRKNNISLRDYTRIEKSMEYGEWEIIELDKHEINGEEMYIEKFILKKEDGKLNIYAKCPLDKIYVLDEDSGKIIWSHEIEHESEPSTPIAIADGKVFFGSDSKIYALDEDTGDLIWSYDLVDEPYSIAVAPGKVFVGTTGNSKIYALDANAGDLIWSYGIEKGVRSVAIASGKVFAGYYKKIYCLDADTGEPIWSYKIEEGIHSIAIADEKVFVGTSDNKIYCFGAAKEEKGVQGFEVILALAGLLVVAYLLRRRARNGR